MLNQTYYYCFAVIHVHNLQMKPLRGLLPYKPHFHEYTLCLSPQIKIYHSSLFFNSVSLYVGVITLCLVSYSYCN